MKGTLFSIIFALTCAGFCQEEAVPAKPKAAEDKTFDKFVGKWKGEGKFGGKEVKVEIEYKWKLNHQYLRCEHKEEAADKSFTYEAVGYFRPAGKDNAFKIWWIDDFGQMTEGGGNTSDKGYEMRWTEKNEKGEVHFKGLAEFTKDGYRMTFFMSANGEKWGEEGVVNFAKAKE